MVKSYTLTLTEEDIETIVFVGRRYAWSEVLYNYDEGRHEILEHEAQEIVLAFEEDDSYFTLLDFQSELYHKLVEFYYSVMEG